jgi:hypothetical protein
MKRLKIPVSRSIRLSEVAEISEPARSENERTEAFSGKEQVLDGYVVNQRWNDFGIVETYSTERGREREKLDSKILSIPAPLACYPKIGHRMGRLIQKD